MKTDHTIHQRVSSTGQKKEMRPGRIKHLLIPVEYPSTRTSTDKLLTCALNLVQRSTGRITLFQVVKPLESTEDAGYGPVVRHDPDKSLVHKAIRRLKTIQRRLADQGQQAECLVLSGTPEEQTPIAVRTVNADAILVLDVV
jgi:hypothetical protein